MQRATLLVTAEHPWPNQGYLAPGKQGPKIIPLDLMHGVTEGPHPAAPECPGRALSSQRMNRSKAEGCSPLACGT